MVEDIRERTFAFAVKVMTFVSNFPDRTSMYVVTRQVLRSGTSIGANVEEATAAFSSNEFVYKVNVALKEARETHYWLRLLKESGQSTGPAIDRLIDESDQLRRILGAVVSKKRKRLRSPGTESAG